MERIEIWSRKFVRPRFVHVRPARPHPFAGWNRYGGIPGTSYKGVTIGFALNLRGHGLSVVWAVPVVRVEDV